METYEAYGPNRDTNKYPPDPPKNCRYCGSNVKLVSASDFYGGNYNGKLYVCQNSSCEARVGTHRGDMHGEGVPLGLLANTDLRRHRSACHALFDPLWREGQYSRRGLYKQMCNWISVPPYKAHIAMLRLKECKNLIWYLIRHGPKLEE